MVNVIGIYHLSRVQTDYKTSWSGCNCTGRLAQGLLNCPSEYKAINFLQTMQVLAGL